MAYCESGTQFGKGWDEFSKNSRDFCPMAHLDEPLRGGVRLPSSSAPRERDSFLKLLSYVDPEAEHGFGFEGVLLRPGSVVNPSELRPDNRWPETPIVLEYARGAAFGPPGRRRREQIYILWRYDMETGAWRELGRSISESWEWALDLRPLAVRALKEARSRSGVIEITADLPAIAARIATFLDGELKPLEARDRARVVGVLHDQFAKRLIA